jgi:hypothetical protein
MAFDISAIRAKLKNLEEGKPKSKRWKPKDEHTIRCLPLSGEEDIALILKWHYGVDADRPMACPSTWDHECPFCDLARRLKSWKDEKGRDKPEHLRKMDWECFKKVDAAVKHYIPIVVRKKESTDVEGPFLWELTPTTYQAVLKICANDDWNDDHPEGGGLRVLTSLVHGLDLVVVLKKPGEKGNAKPFPLTEVEERKKFSPIFKSGDGGEQRARGLLDRIPNISEIARPVTTEEAEKVFAAWEASMSEGGSESSRSDGTEYGGGKPTGGERPAQSGGDVDETVAKLEAMLNNR